jgi:L-ascorbate metabolism protein UlaG (beta-lactamase superfamily)
VALLIAVSPLRADAHLEYIAHACFVVESPTGVRVVIDPYNTYRWLGYHFPANIPANAVLVSHPHYDHDASYY